MGLIYGALCLSYIFSIHAPMPTEEAHSPLPGETEMTMATLLGESDTQPPCDTLAMSDTLVQLDSESDFDGDRYRSPSPSLPIRRRSPSPQSPRHSLDPTPQSSRRSWDKDFEEPDTGEKCSPSLLPESTTTSQKKKKKKKEGMLQGIMLSHRQIRLCIFVTFALCLRCGLSTYTRPWYALCILCLVCR